MRPVDFTTLSAIAAELRASWIPARAEQVYQRDRHTIAIALRTLKGRDWLTISWHPQAARLHIDTPPPKTPDTFTFSDQLRHQLNGLALTAIEAIAPWERALDLQFARRPGEEPLWHLLVEIMGKYSNVILTDRDWKIVTAAHQVSAEQSSVRSIQTGQSYAVPPPPGGNAPSWEESYSHWQERVALIPGQLKRQLLQSYRGLSPAAIDEITARAGLDPQQPTTSLAAEDWQALFHVWQLWLKTLASEQFSPGWTETGYTVLGWEADTPVSDVQTLMREYYGRESNQQVFKQLRHQLLQKLAGLLKKLRGKAESFRDRLHQSDDADRYRQQADLLMAHLHQWQPGMKAIALNDFETGEAIEIPLQPDKNAVQNAQALYKQHQKLKRARRAVEPLLAEVEAEIAYLEQVEANVERLEQCQYPEDLQALEEIRDELSEQGYFPAGREKTRSDRDATPPFRYRTPGGFEVSVGRNNRQNDRLSFRVAVDYDLWFHSQEIPGSHVLLHLEPGAVPDDVDLQCAADLAAYHSRARQSDAVPVVYTKPKHVYKPKGAKPGMAIYQRETVLWGHPQAANQYAKV